MTDPHPHFDLYCREHEVRIGGCRCASPEKLKQYADCPGETCSGSAPTPKQREEREWLKERVDTEIVTDARGRAVGRRLLEPKLPLSEDDTHSPEEPDDGD